MAKFEKTSFLYGILFSVCVFGGGYIVYTNADQYEMTAAWKKKIDDYMMKKGCVYKCPHAQPQKPLSKERISELY
jgi:hypothetical protein